MLEAIEFIRIPAGEFLYGVKKEKLYLPDYEIAKYPVTVAQYRAYCQSSNKEMPVEPEWGWLDNHPMVNVSWNDAKAFCDYYGYRLPTEQEWEKAARGTDGREYPWGDDWDENKCVNLDSSPNGTQPVGSYPNGASQYGCMDMAGNVLEWTNCLVTNDQQSHVLRGGSWHFGSAKSSIFRCVCQSKTNSINHSDFCGFRVAR